jgi:hypothetical protein
MLSIVQDDRVALALNTQMLPYVNFELNISAIDVNGCGGPFGLNTPVFYIKVVDVPDGNFNIYNNYTILDEWTVTGIEPGATPYTFNWSLHNVSFNVSQATNGNVAIIWDLLQSGYAAFDNIRITSSQTPSGLTHPNVKDNSIRVSPTLANNTVKLNLPFHTAIQVFNTCDALLMQTTYDTHELNVSALPSGLYYIKTEQGAVTSFVKQ